MVVLATYHWVLSMLMYPCYRWLHTSIPIASLIRLAMYISLSMGVRLHWENQLWRKIDAHTYEMKQFFLIHHHWRLLHRNGKLHDLFDWKQLKDIMAWHIIWFSGNRKVPILRMCIMEVHIVRIIFWALNVPLILKGSHGGCLVSLEAPIVTLTTLTLSSDYNAWQPIHFNAIKRKCIHNSSISKINN